MFNRGETDGARREREFEDVHGMLLWKLRNPGRRKKELMRIGRLRPNEDGRQPAVQAARCGIRG